MSLTFMRPASPPLWRLAAVLAVSASLGGCFGGDDGTVVPPASSASAPLSAAQINAAQLDLDARSAPVDVTSAAGADISSSQTALDQQAGLTTEAPR